MKIGLLTCDRLLHIDQVKGRDRVQIESEDSLIIEALRSRHGLEAMRLSWSDSDVAWQDMDRVLIRNPWDYYKRFDAFSAWLSSVKQQTKLYNPPELVSWNGDKRYLLALAERGLPVVPTTLVSMQTVSADAEVSELDQIKDARTREPFVLAKYMVDQGFQDVVIKPTVSGGAMDTFRVARSESIAFQAQLNALLTQYSLLVQPLVPSVLDLGEVSMIVVGGEYQHAVRKIPRLGDFRVQEDHGGSVVRYEPTEHEIDLAQRIVRACDPMPLYARVDVVRDLTGKWMLMELELIEPELFLRTCPATATVLADALVTA